ncbi:TRAP dicarboxylate transporter, DctP subunit [Pantoea sp. AS-PWVM4]|uniref:TRAP transporter substrate-binding protein n=1 Tax=Pantoea sp. AS-PWVM4 TaxID=1332069 RepID=UPI0003AC7667|nr:TRAP transporter substrate-binding protein [Pantoea sp. AS-PWVM4]ERK16294.1 TRAP dicarboxylate transporter, DctP subunit [Pantoea sp. AS-PWVM4]
MQRRTFLKALSAGMALSVLPLKAFAKNATVMKIGTSTINDSQHQWMINFARIAESKAQGQLKVEIFPASQLGSTTRLIEQTQMSTIQGVVAPPEFLSGINEAFSVLSAPGKFDGMEHIARTLADQQLNNYLFSLGESKGLKGLGMFLSGPSAFCAREEIRTPEQFVGKKVRVLPAKIQQAQIKAMGGAPLPMPPSEVLPALQQGTLDAVMSCIPVMESLSFSDGAKHFIETNHGVISSMAAVSADWFSDLSKELQEIIVQSGQEATASVRQFSIDDVNDAKSKWVKKGGNIITLTDSERDAFFTKLLPTGPAVVKENPDMEKAFTIYMQAIQRARNVT